MIHRKFTAIVEGYMVKNEEKIRRVIEQRDDACGFASSVPLLIRNS